MTAPGETKERLPSSERDFTPTDKARGARETANARPDERAVAERLVHDAISSAVRAATDAIDVPESAYDWGATDARAALLAHYDQVRNSAFREAHEHFELRHKEVMAQFQKALESAVVLIDEQDRLKAEIAKVMAERDEALAGVTKAMQASGIMQQRDAALMERDALRASNARMREAIANELRDGYCFNRMDEARRALRNIALAAQDARRTSAQDK